MHLAQLRQPLTRAAANSCHSVCRLPTTHSVSATAILSEQFAHLRIGPSSSNVAVEGRRYASVKAQGAYRLKPKRTIPKKLGAKKTGGMFHQMHHTRLARIAQQQHSETLTDLVSFCSKTST